MQQQPEKLAWRGQSVGGLSASTFGMALGFCGRICDYVRYVREVVGTPMEFKGNDATAHGCRTEAKARACYEFITGNKVRDGGFFTTEDRILACSPDGIVDVPENERAKPSIDRVEMSRQRSGFRPHRPSDEPPFRLLEIKSPFKSLYDGSRKLYQPHGIPLQYMCQMQGQMTISGALECDFFVFLDTPTDCQVVGWRVKRSSAFWEWCEPKLRLVSSWIREGLPEGIDRNFRFERFDFKILDVHPIIAPFSITYQRHLLDEKKFGFFVSCYAGLRKQMQVQMQEKKREENDTLSSNFRRGENNRMAPKSKFQILPRGLRGHASVMGRFSKPTAQQVPSAHLQWSIYDAPTQASQCEEGTAVPPSSESSSIDFPRVQGVVWPGSSVFPVNLPLTWDAARAFFGGTNISICTGSGELSEEKRILRLRRARGDGSGSPWDQLRFTEITDADVLVESILAKVFADQSFVSSVFVFGTDWDTSVVRLTVSTPSVTDEVSSEDLIEVPFHLQAFWRRVEWSVATSSENGVQSGQFVTALTVREARSPTTPVFPLTAQFVTNLGGTLETAPSRGFSYVFSPPPAFPSANDTARPTKVFLQDGLVEQNRDLRPLPDTTLPSSGCINANRRVAVRTLVKLPQKSALAASKDAESQNSSSISKNVSDACFPTITKASPPPLLSLGAAAKSAAAFQEAVDAVLGKELSQGLEELVEKFCLGSAGQAPDGHPHLDVVELSSSSPPSLFTVACVKSVFLLADAHSQHGLSQIIFSETDSAVGASDLIRFGSLICAPVSLLEALYSRGTWEGKNKQCAIELDSDCEDLVATASGNLTAVKSGGHTNTCANLSDTAAVSQETKSLQVKLSKIPSVVLRFARSSFCEEDQEDSGLGIAESSTVCQGGTSRMSTEAQAVKDYLVSSHVFATRTALGFARPIGTPHLQVPKQELQSPKEKAVVSGEKKSKFSILAGRSVSFRSSRRECSDSGNIESPQTSSDSLGSSSLGSCYPQQEIHSPLSSTSASCFGSHFLVVGVGPSPPSDCNLFRKCAYLRLEWSVFERKMLRAAHRNDVSEVNFAYSCD